MTKGACIGVSKELKGTDLERNLKRLWVVIPWTLFDLEARQAKPTFRNLTRIYPDRFW